VVAAIWEDSPGGASAGAAGDGLAPVAGRAMVLSLFSPTAATSSVRTIRWERSILTEAIVERRS
jgi:hypothetical protein